MEVRYLTKKGQQGKVKLSKSRSQPGTVALSCNLSYLGGRDQKDGSWRVGRQKVPETTISTNKPGVVTNMCLPNQLYRRHM
jgi:hypothetical protein